MKLSVSNLSRSGIAFDFNEKTTWVLDALSQGLGDIYRRTDPIKGSLSVQAMGIHNLFFRANLNFYSHPTCARCLKTIDEQQSLHIERFLVPIESLQPQRVLDEEVLDINDLDVTGYMGQEVDLSQILTEEIALSQPMVYLCQPDCKGLCFRCGIDLNKISCQCREKTKEERSPFAVLKKMKR